MFLYKFKSKCLPLLKTAVFQGFTKAALLQFQDDRRGAQTSTWEDVALGPRFLVKFPRMGKAIEVKCPTYARGPPASGLTLIHALWWKTCILSHLNVYQVQLSSLLSCLARSRMFQGACLLFLFPRFPRFCWQYFSVCTTSPIHSARKTYSLLYWGFREIF